MIDKFTVYGVKVFTPVCDLCEEELPAEYGFEDAVAAIRGEGWITKKTGDGWKNYCPKCAAAINSARRDFDD